MVELSFSRNHITSLTLPFMSLEIYADDQICSQAELQHFNQLIEKAWPLFLHIAEQEKLYEALTLNLKKKVLEVELVWTNNLTMQSLNQQYRQKEEPTDVLTFTLLADADDPDLWMSLPVLQLGSIFISIEYAQAAIQTLSDTPLDRYLLERFIHGMLHLFGMHHDTMEKFEKVVTIQNRVLEAVFQ
jgi:probable rRNA maturation factor